MAGTCNNFQHVLQARPVFAVTCKHIGRHVNGAPRTSEDHGVIAELWKMPQISAGTTMTAAAQRPGRRARSPEA